MTNMSRFLLASTSRLNRSRPVLCSAATRRMSWIAATVNGQAGDQQDHRPGLLALGLVIGASVGLSSSGKAQSEATKEAGAKEEATALATSHAGLIPRGLNFPGLTPLVTVSPKTTSLDEKIQALKIVEEDMQEEEKLRLASLLYELHELAKEKAAVDQQKNITYLSRRYSSKTLQATLSVPSNLHNLTPSQAHEMVAGLHKEELLDKKSLIQLIDRATEVLRQEPTLINLRTTALSPKSRVTVVGDLHGSLTCLQHVLDIVGDLGDPENKVVFDGDFVDRGKNSLEVFFTLLLYKLAYPTNVILLRGNHEDAWIASRYGFCDEIHEKYGKERGTLIFKAVCDLFAALPICAVTDNAFIVHGGLPHNRFSIDQVAAISSDSRSQMHTVLQHWDHKKAKLLEGLMWSDPSSDNGVAPNQRRGNRGCFFGPDVAKDFLDREGLTYLLRGHESAEYGAEVMNCGDGKAVVTVFSTANYPNGGGKNLGAVVQIDNEGNVHSTEFSYTKPHVENDPEKVLQALMAENRDKIIAAFESIQRNNRVTPKQWVETMQNILEIPHIPWAKLQPKLAPTVGEMPIDWRQHLDRIAPTLSTSRDSEQARILRANSEQVRRIFELLDVDESGAIGKKEFLLGVEMLNKKLLPPEQQIDDPEALFQALDMDKTGEIDIVEFMQSAAIKYISSSVDQEQVSILGEKHEVLLAVFEFLDNGGSGSINRSEFRRGMSLLNKRLPEESRFNDIDKLFGAMDADRSGDIDFAEFNQVFQI